MIESGQTQKLLTATSRSAAPSDAMISVEFGEMEMIRLATGRVVTSRAGCFSQALAAMTQMIDT
ncbi:MAG: hypothetical protein AMXMBFR20_05190 [Planctomycetia bacterium]